tara:strand:- start:256 stop:1656 length:1401 start_codon:yes stop_codon:yes gene_type:complete
VLWICTDQQRHDTIRSLGNPHINTPCIDSLVGEGVAFTQAYAQSPVCTPSRAAFMTGRYPRTTKCRQNGQALPPNEKLVSRLFADDGYTCGLAGKLHLATCANGVAEARIDDGYSVFHWSHHPQPDWPENAYTQWLYTKGTSWEEVYGGASTDYIKHGVPEEYNQTTWCADSAIEFIHEQNGAPWFFSYNCFAPHHPFDPPEEFLARYNPDDMPLPKARPDELETKTTYQQLDGKFSHNDPEGYDITKMTDRDKREVTAAYYAMVELIDKQVGRMVAALEETGQLENTIVIFMSDHGEMLGDHGLFLKGPHFYDEAVRVPLIISWKDRFAADLRADCLMELIDITPTLLEAAEIDVPKTIQGRSLMPILLSQREAGHHRDYVFSEYYNAWTHKHSYGSMLRTREEKIVVYHGTDQGELYDLKNDPDEFENLWNSPEHTKGKLRLMKACFDASVFTMDPCPIRLGPF